MSEPSNMSINAANQFLGAQPRALVLALAACFDNLRELGRIQGIEQAMDVALQYRDEADDGKHPDVSDPAHSLGQGYAANRIAKRIGALIT